MLQLSEIVDKNKSHEFKLYKQYLEVHCLHSIMLALHKKGQLPYHKYAYITQLINHYES